MRGIETESPLNTETILPAVLNMAATRSGTTSVVLHSLKRCFLVALCTVANASSRADEYTSRVGVQQPSRLDWSFAVADQSVANPPPKLVNHIYDSSKQTYEWFGPKPRKRSNGKPVGTARPLIVHVSPTGRASGWRDWEHACRRAGMMFAGPRGTKKGTEDSLRIRIVLDVLDDVRRRHPVDPDKTYIAGFYGGARIANKIAFRLPEYFGGVIVMAEGVSAPNEPYEQARLAERISVAQLVGRKDMPGPGNQRVGIMRILNGDLMNTDIRTQLAFYSGPVTAMPPAGLLLKAVRWLESDVDRRRKLSAVYPSTSLSNSPSPEQHARLVFTDAMTDLELPETTYRGLLRLEHVRRRWPDLETASKANALLDEYSQRDGPWQKQREDDQRRILAAQICKLRPIREIDPPRDRTQLPSEFAPVGIWIDFSESTLNQNSSKTEFEEYDERTEFVIERLGGRVHRDVNERINMINLAGTRVTSTQLKHFKGQLHGMKELRALDLSRTVMSESTLNNIADLKSLHALNLSDSELTNKSSKHLRELESLRYLSIANTSVTTAGIERFKSLRKLRCVNLGGTNVDDGVLPLLAVAPDLSVLSLASTRITPASDFTSFRSLTYLDLTNTSASDDVVATLVGLPHLKTLILDYTRISDESTAELTKMTTLAELSLLGTKIGDAGLVNLEQLTSLSRLNVRSTRVTKNGLNKLSDLKPALQLISEANRDRDVESQRRLLLHGSALPE